MILQNIEHVLMTYVTQLLLIVRKQQILLFLHVNLSVASEVPGLSDEVEPERNRSLFWHWIWLESDKPRFGFVYDIMKRIRHRYHYAIRSCKKQKQEIQKRKLIENISNSKDF